MADKDIVNKTPHLGNYFLTEEELLKYSSFDFVIIADMALPEDNVLRLANHADVVIFDHHLQKEIKEVSHNNPIIKGENPDRYPSASWVVNTFLGNKLSLFAVLGAIGDHEQKIKNNKLIWKEISDFCKKSDLRFDDLLKMVYLLDSNYKLGDKKAVEEAPHLLKDCADFHDILDNKKWNNNLNKLEKEIAKQLSQHNDVKDGIIIKKMNTSYNIISTITRKVAWESGKNTVVINSGFFSDLDQVYVRSLKNTEPMIKRGKELVFKCGGKKEVLGAIVPKDETDSFVQEILDFLKK